jgi:hypothetical protein
MSRIIVGLIFGITIILIILTVLIFNNQDSKNNQTSDIESSSISRDIPEESIISNDESGDSKDIAALSENKEHSYNNTSDKITKKEKFLLSSYTRESLQQKGRSMSVEELVDLKIDIFKSLYEHDNNHLYLTEYPVIVATGLYEKDRELLNSVFDESKRLFEKALEKRGHTNALKEDADDKLFRRKYALYCTFSSERFKMTIHHKNHDEYWGFFKIAMASPLAGIRHMAIVILGRLVIDQNVYPIEKDEMKQYLIQAEKAEKKNLIYTDRSDFMISENVQNTLFEKCKIS